MALASGFLEGAGESCAKEVRVVPMCGTHSHKSIGQGGHNDSNSFNF